jgi:hypothetical protein
MTQTTAVKEMANDPAGCQSLSYFANDSQSVLVFLAVDKTITG